MRFSKTDNIYKIIRITGSQDNILGVGDLKYFMEGSYDQRCSETALKIA